MRVLVLNAGSSTLKASRLEGDADSGDDVTLEWPAGEADADRVLAAVLERLPGDTDAVGHRVVHGGAGHDRPAVVDDHLVGEVEALDVLAPLHNRRAASVMRAGLAALPA